MTDENASSRLSRPVAPAPATDDAPGDAAERTAAAVPDENRTLPDGTNGPPGAQGESAATRGGASLDFPGSGETGSQDPAPTSASRVAGGDALLDAGDVAPDSPPDFRVYDPAVDPFDAKGYPRAWQTLKHVVREQAGHRCVRCGHPYRVGEQGSGEWTKCSPECVHGGEMRYNSPLGTPSPISDTFPAVEPEAVERGYVEARWRILTVHHLNGDKADLRWWNLAALCQRCHLTIQGKVRMERPYVRPHSDWFVPYVCGFYAVKYLGEELTREEALGRRDELLMLELIQPRLEGFPT